MGPIIRYQHLSITYLRVFRTGLKTLKFSPILQPAKTISRNPNHDLRDPTRGVIILNFSGMRSIKLLVASALLSSQKKEIYFNIKQIPFLLSLYLTTLHFLEKLDLLKGRNSLLKYLAGFTDLVSNNPGSCDLGLNDKRSNTQQRVKQQRIKMGKIIYVLHKKTIYGPD